MGNPNSRLKAHRKYDWEELTIRFEFLFVCALSSSCLKEKLNQVDHETLNEREAEKSNNRAKINHSQRRDKPSKEVEVGIGVVTDKLHQPVVVQLWKPRADDPRKNHEGINAEDKVYKDDKFDHNLITRLELIL
jgi:hypothetical protein